MEQPINGHLFSEPHWRVIAQGFQTESWFNDGQAIGTGGILKPRPCHLKTGHYYYRFASTSSPREAQLGGGWWLEFEEYNKVRSFSQKNDYSIRDAARLMLALPYAWTQVDVLVKALLQRPLKAYAGEGKPAQGSKDGADRATTWIPTQHIKVCQLYIPGLFVRGTRPREQIYEKAFSYLETTSLLR